MTSVLCGPSNQKIDDFQDWNLEDVAEEPKDVDNIASNKVINSLTETVSHIQKIPRRGEQVPEIHKERDRRDTRKNKKGNKKNQDEISGVNEEHQVQDFENKASNSEMLPTELKQSRKPSRKNKQGRGKKPKLNAEGDEPRKQRKGNKKQRKPKQPKNRRNKQKSTTTVAPVQESAP